MRRRPADATLEPAEPPFDFVPVELVGRPAISTDPADDAIASAMPPPLPGEPEQSWTERTSLFGEPEV